MPHAILASAATQSIKATAPGVFYDGTVSMGQENHRDAADLEKTISHEIFLACGNAQIGWMIMTAILTPCWECIGGGVGLVRLQRPKPKLWNHFACQPD